MKHYRLKKDFLYTAYGHTFKAGTILEHIKGDGVMIFLNPTNNSIPQCQISTIMVLNNPDWFEPVVEETVVIDGKEYDKKTVLDGIKMIEGLRKIFRNTVKR